MTYAIISLMGIVVLGAEPARTKPNAPEGIYIDATYRYLITVPKFPVSADAQNTQLCQISYTLDGKMLPGIVVSIAKPIDRKTSLAQQAIEQAAEPEMSGVSRKLLTVAPHWEAVLTECEFQNAMFPQVGPKRMFLLDVFRDDYSFAVMCTAPVEAYKKYQKECREWITGFQFQPPEAEQPGSSSRYVSGQYGFTLTGPRFPKAKAKGNNAVHGVFFGGGFTPEGKALFPLLRVTAEAPASLEAKICQTREDARANGHPIISEDRWKVKGREAWLLRTLAGPDRRGMLNTLLVFDTQYTFSLIGCFLADENEKAVEREMDKSMMSFDLLDAADH